MTQPSHPRRSAFWMIAAVVFSVAILPLLVHSTGRYVLGEYTGGGVAAFYGHYLHGLLTLRWYSWVLACGPVLIVLFWSMLVRVGPRAGG